MAAEKGLNPQASAYLPRSLQPFLPIFSTPSPLPTTTTTTSRYYFRPLPPHGGAYNYYTTLPPSSFYNSPLPLYTTDSYSDHPNSSSPPPLPPVEAPPSPTVLIKAREVGGRRERGRRRSCKKGFRRSGSLWRKVGDCDCDGDKEGKLGFGKGKNSIVIHHPQRFGSFGSSSIRAQVQHPVLPLTVDEPKTTIMIKNVPNKYNRGMLLKFLDEHCMLENQRNKNNAGEEPIVSAFDFVYLPIDFKTGCNKGYAFVNFTEARAVWKFYHAFHNTAWESFQSRKIREIVCAKIQGKEALVRHFEKSTFRCDSDELLPACFSPARDGSGKLVRQRVVGELI